MKLATCLKQNLPKINDEGEIELSLYEGSLDEPIIIENIAKIKASFPQLPIQFYSILTDRIKEKGFTNQQLIDAVNNVIDNCVYPVPTIANFLNHDKKVKLFTYSDMLKKVHDSGCDSSIWKWYDKKKINGVTFWHEKLFDL